MGDCPLFLTPALTGSGFVSTAGVAGPGLFPTSPGPVFPESAVRAPGWARGDLTPRTTRRRDAATAAPCF